MPNVDYITAIESVCPKLKEEEALELRAYVNSLLRKAKVPKANLTKQERIGLYQLKKDKERVILTVNKGVAMVIMDREDYNNKAQEIPNSPAYRSLPGDSTNKIKAQLINISLGKSKRTETWMRVHIGPCILLVVFHQQFYGLHKNP